MTIDNSFRAVQARRFVTERSRRFGLIGLEEIAQHIAERKAGIPASQAVRGASFHLIWSDIRKGVFHQDGRSMVLLVNSGVKAARLTEERMELELGGLHGLQREISREGILSCCWILPQQAICFFAAHGLPLPDCFKSRHETHDGILSRRLSVQTAHNRSTAKRRGPAPVIYARVAKAMREEFPDEASCERLITMKQDELAERYHASGSTCGEVRRRRLAEFPKYKLRRTLAKKK